LYKYICIKIINMELEFICPDCKTIFEDKGFIKNVNDPIFGPCSYRVATCPKCGAEAGEYSPEKSTTQTDHSFSCPSGGCGKRCGM